MKRRYVSLKVWLVTIACLVVIQFLFVLEVIRSRREIGELRRQFDSAASSFSCHCEWTGPSRIEWLVTQTKIAENRAYLEALDEELSVTQSRAARVGLGAGDSSQEIYQLRNELSDLREQVGVKPFAPRLDGSIQDRLDRLER